MTSFTRLKSRKRPVRNRLGNRPRRRALRHERLEDRALLSAGELDPTFGDAGLVTTDFGYSPSEDYGRDVVAVQADGKIVVVGSSYAPSGHGGWNFAVARYNTDGSLDTGFGIDGKVVTNFGLGAFAFGVAIDADGKIVVAGYSYQASTGQDFALARYNTDGSLYGWVTTDLGATWDFALDVAIDGAGKIVVAGYSNQGGTTGWDFAMARYDSIIGDLDTTFDGDGKVTTDFGSSQEIGYAVAIDAGGRIVVAGSSSGDFLLARYNSDGSLDTTFDTDGKVTTDFAGSYDAAYGVAIDAGGKIVVVGLSNQGSPTYSDFALARYNSSDGSLDTGFGTGGKVTTDFGSWSDYAQGVAIDAVGNIVLAGFSYQGNPSYGGTGKDFALARYIVSVEVGPITAPVDPVEVNTEITASASFTNPDVPNTHTAVWDWGDSTTSAGTVSQTNGSGTVTGSHTYTAAGIYTVTLTVTVGGSTHSDQSVLEYVVVFDPSAGFVTGGGWIDSPEGAVVAAPWATGRASFGFVSKYEKGANVPTGQTQFQFRLPGYNRSRDINFHSTDYQWLVVGGAKARFKGTGTINHEGNYGFMLTAIDGQINGGGGQDKFRIKIWDKDTDTLVYDNQLDAADDSDPTTLLRGGSIVIHSNGEALRATDGAPVRPFGATLAQATLAPVVEQAMSYWAAGGVGADSLATLGRIDVHVADLSGSVLGIASSSNLVWIDRDAAGYGWKDPNGTLGQTTGGMDLLSVVTHELGHKLGLQHGNVHDVMAPSLAPNVRTVAVSSSLVGYFAKELSARPFVNTRAFDQQFAQWKWADAPELRASVRLSPDPSDQVAEIVKAGLQPTWLLRSRWGDEEDEDRTPGIEELLDKSLADFDSIFQQLGREQVDPETLDNLALCLVD